MRRDGVLNCRQFWDGCLWPSAARAAQAAREVAIQPTQIRSTKNIATPIAMYDGSPRLTAATHTPRVGPATQGPFRCSAVNRTGGSRASWDG